MHGMTYDTKGMEVVTLVCDDVNTTQEESGDVCMG